jgi:hypothetical protein
VHPQVADSRRILDESFAETSASRHAVVWAPASALDACGAELGPAFVAHVVAIPSSHTLIRGRENSR